MIVPLARMDAASRLRMLEDTDDLRTMQKEKLVILFIKVCSFKIRLIFYFWWLFLDFRIWPLIRNILL